MRAHLTNFSFEFFFMKFHRRCLSTSSIPWCKKVKNDQKLKSSGRGGGGPALGQRNDGDDCYWHGTDKTSVIVYFKIPGRWFFGRKIKSTYSILKIHTFLKRL